jgi:integrase
MSLTDTAVKNAKPENKERKLSDSGGLYLLIKPTGYKCWKYDFRLDSTRGSYTIGNYPDISLKKAREEHREARELVAMGINPKQIKIQRKVKDELKNKRFSFYMNQWLEKQVLAKSTYSDLKQRIDKNLIPYLDGKYINEILVLRIIDSNPAQGLAELLPKPDRRIDNNFGHITDETDLRNLLKQIDCPTPKQDFAVTQALKLMPLVFLRPYNIRFLKWEYINFDDRIINIPATELKNNKPLDVPLAEQAIDILKDMQAVTGDKEYVFVTSRGKDTPQTV